MRTLQTGSRFDLKCPNCGTITNEDSDFCPSCGRTLIKRTKFPLVAGIFAIIGSCLAFISGTVLLIGAWLQFNVNNQIFLHNHSGPYLPFPTYFLSLGIFAIVTFAFGLFAGIAAVNRKFVKPTIFGLSLLTISGVLISAPINSSTSWQIGSTITLLSVMSIISIMKSKPEFH